MGVTKAWLLAALDPRIKLCVDLWCMTDFEELIKTNDLKGQGVYYYAPILLKHCSTARIKELIVPRAPRPERANRSPDAAGGRWRSMATILDKVWSYACRNILT